MNIFDSLPLKYRGGLLHIDGVSLADLAQTFGTPLYLYSATQMEERFRAMSVAATGRKHLICYALKANSNLSVVRHFAEMGAGCDIVSGGELYRALKAGVPASKIVFSGAGKSIAEMREALLAGIMLFSVESESELAVLANVAASSGMRAPVSIRVNPDIDAKTHPYISTGLKENKFGVPHEHVLELYKRALSLEGIDPCGISFHVGSQLTDLKGILEASDKVSLLIDDLVKLGVKLRYIDAGGGLGITYKDENVPSPEDYVKAVLEKFPLPDVTIIVEPGRSLAGNAGILLGRLFYIKESKERKFYIGDVAMTDLIRPSLYDAYHEIYSVRESAMNRANLVESDLVGPVCESGDFIAKGRVLPDLKPGELFAVASCGAYGFAMSSQYNSRPRAAEVMIQNGQPRLIRRRESYEDLIRGET